MVLFYFLFFFHANNGPRYSLKYDFFFNSFELQTYFLFSVHFFWHDDKPATFKEVYSESTSKFFLLVGNGFSVLFV